MKRRWMAVWLCLCLALTLLPAPAWAAGPYSLTLAAQSGEPGIRQTSIRIGSEYTWSGGSTEAAEGTRVLLNCALEDGYLFTGWSVEPAGAVSMDDLCSTYFDMPASDLSFRAGVEKLDPDFQIQDGVATWKAVDGYQSKLAVDGSNPSFLYQAGENGRYTVNLEQAFQSLEYMAIVILGSSDTSGLTGDYSIDLSYAKNDSNGNAKEQGLVSNVGIYHYEAGKLTKLGTPQNLRWDGFAAQWDAVEGAGRYRVIFTEHRAGSSRECGSEYVSGTRCELGSIVGTLADGATYTFTVQAWNGAEDVSCLPGEASAPSGQSAVYQAPAPASYGITVDGTEVTSENAADVLGDGTVSYDPETNTLTLKGAVLKENASQGAILAQAGLNLVRIGENRCEGRIRAQGDIRISGSGSLTVTTTENNHPCLSSEEGAIAVDGGKLSLTATDPYTAAMKNKKDITIENAEVIAIGPNSGISSDNGTVRIEDSTVTAEGRYGINADYKGAVEIRGSQVILNGTDMCGAYAKTMDVWDSRISTATESYAYSLWILDTLTLRNSTFESQSPQYGVRAGNLLVEDRAEGEQASELTIQCGGGACVLIAPSEGTGVFRVTPQPGVWMDAFTGSRTDGTDAERMEGAPFDTETVWTVPSGGNYFRLGSHVHEGTLVEGKEATCTEAGVKDYYTCAVCGTSFEDEACTAGIADLDSWKVIPANGHQWETDAATGGRCCAVCGCMFYEVWVDTREVTSENAADVLGDGTVSYDPETKTLTLKDAGIQVTEGLGERQGFYGIWAQGDLNLRLEGENSVSFSDEPTDGASAAVWVQGGLSIDGSGSLEAIAGFGGLSACGIWAGGDIQILGGTVTAAGSGSWESAPESGGGILSEDGDITIQGAGTVVKAYSGYAQNRLAGIGAEGGSVTLRDQAQVEALAETFTTENGGSTGSGLYAYGGICLDGAQVIARGGQANYTSGMFSETGDITVESGLVAAAGGRAVNYEDPDAADSAGIYAGAGRVQIRGGQVITETGLTEHGTAAGIRAQGDVEITGGAVQAAGASVSIDGVEPVDSWGIFSETGHVILSGEDTRVRADGGYAEEESTGICARDIRFSGGTFAAAGSTGGISCQGSLTVCPDQSEILIKTLAEQIWGRGGWDWEQMETEAAEIPGSPFTEETEIPEGLTQGQQYVSGSCRPADPTDPTEPTDPTDSSQEGEGSDAPKTGDAGSMARWFLVLALSGGAAAGILVYDRRRNG